MNIHEFIKDTNKNTNFFDAIKELKALGNVQRGSIQMGQVCDTTVTLDRYTLGISKCAHNDEVNIVWTISLTYGHQRFHESFRAAMEFLARH